MLSFPCHFSKLTFFEVTSHDRINNYPTARNGSLDEVPGGGDGGGKRCGGGGGVDGHGLPQDAGHQHGELGGEEEEEEAGEDLADDEEEEEQGEGVGEGGGRAASRDQAQSSNQEEDAAWDKSCRLLHGTERSQYDNSREIPSTMAAIASLPSRLSLQGSNSCEPRRLKILLLLETKN